MALIKVPKLPKSAFNPNRPISGLLKMQIDHLQHAARRLPLRYRSEIYVNAIQTEGEAAEYVRDVTEAIHKAHDDAERMRQARLAPKRKRVISIAAVADERAERKQRAKAKSRTKARKPAGKPERKK